MVKILSPLSNRWWHYTKEYELSPGDPIVLRRGQEFVLRIEYDRKISYKDDEILLVFTYGIYI